MLSLTRTPTTLPASQRRRVALNAPRRALRLPVHAAAAADAKTDDALKVLQAAAATGQVPPGDVFQAMMAVEKAKLPAEADWPTLLGGSGSPGNRWRLVFTTGTKDIQAALKGGNGSGKYFPVTAVQRWDASKREIENGIFFGHLAALTFKGPYSFEGKKLYFDFDTLKLKLLGGKFEFKLKEKIDPSTFKPGKDLPFFIFLFVDDKLVVARGRGGGLAVWARTTPAWELEKGVA